MTDHHTIELMRHVSIDMKKLLDKIIKHIRQDELIEIIHWQGPLFFISVKDATLKTYHINFSINAEKGKICWNNDTDSNCFVRHKRWKSLGWVKRIPRTKMRVH